ncbi:MAG: hypothetical protein IJV97_01280 [Alphaproteobacteria bacterium]|nr:hypothetical protein [Alphaproteobacteria bacterium]
MTKEDLNSYDFLINEEDEVMLLLYARESAPQNSTIEISVENKSAVFYRNADDVLNLTDIPDEVLDCFADTDKLLVCEISHEEDEKDTQITYAYEAEITD